MYRAIKQIAVQYFLLLAHSCRRINWYAPAADTDYTYLFGWQSLVEAATLHYKHHKMLSKIRRTDA